MPALMIQGTTSDAGKSAFVCGLARCLYRKGLLVAPFKPQNMALNSAVTFDGGEIGRAQALQAQAAGVPASVHMNPILIKPSSDIGAQVIVQGKVFTHTDAAGYQSKTANLLHHVLDSWNQLSAQYPYIVVEGAGSPAEINLRENDIANMGFAEAVDCPVILIADIDRGGVFAHIVGTLELLSESERARIKGFVINKFRGDISLLESGLSWLEIKTGKPVFGVLPYLKKLHLEAEDGFAGFRNSTDTCVTQLRVVVPLLPRISNHTDFDPLALRNDVDFRYIRHDEPMGQADLVILPGTKSVRQDLAWLREQGWDHAIKKHLRYGGKLIGICGGFQMLGASIADPDAVEGKAGVSEGFGYLDMHTVLLVDKKLKRVSGKLSFGLQPCEGYEIHAGNSVGPALKKPVILFEKGQDGAVSDDNQILGTYLHGLFTNSACCNALLQWAGLEEPIRFDYETLREQGIDDMANLCERHLDMDRIFEIMR